ncbi:unnamed protein product [Rangifer tarandus platyrhynchus]|uniref:Uncharacterized protein n=1 Tax=Rangifer tarandus platyrhynchus TaxID=3082113 RepID=A0AC60A6Y3_RANTA
MAPGGNQWREFFILPWDEELGGGVWNGEQLHIQERFRSLTLPLTSRCVARFLTGHELGEKSRQLRGAHMKQAGVSEIPLHLDSVPQNAEGAAEKKRQDREQRREERASSVLGSVSPPNTFNGPRS